MATWLELVGAVMLLLGLATRSVAYVFWVLTIVAIAAVHWPDQWNGLGELWQGYAITARLRPQAAAPAAWGGAHA